MYTHAILAEPTTVRTDKAKTLMLLALAKSPPHAQLAALFALIYNSDLEWKTNLLMTNHIQRELLALEAHIHMCACIDIILLPARQ